MDAIDYMRGAIWNRLGLLNPLTRTKIQQFTWLLEAHGVDVGFAFGWGWETVHSKTLRQYIREYGEELTYYDYKDVQFSTEAEELFERIEALVAAQPEDIQTKAWVDLVVNISFIIKQKFCEESDIYDFLRRNNRHEHRDHVLAAIKEVKKSIGE